MLKRPRANGLYATRGRAQAETGPCTVTYAPVEKTRHEIIPWIFGCVGNRAIFAGIARRRVSVKPGLWTELDSWTGLMDWNLD